MNSVIPRWLAKVGQLQHRRGSAHHGPVKQTHLPRRGQRPPATTRPGGVQRRAVTEMGPPAHPLPGAVSPQAVGVSEDAHVCPDGTCPFFRLLQNPRVHIDAPGAQPPAVAQTPTPGPVFEQEAAKKNTQLGVSGHPRALLVRRGGYGRVGPSWCHTQKRDGLAPAVGWQRHWRSCLPPARAGTCSGIPPAEYFPSRRWRPRAPTLTGTGAAWQDLRRE